jgi:hypothetical protein
MHGATISMQCLVCAGEARDRTPQNFDGYVIECPICGNYEVAGGAGDRLENASMQDRAAALAKAQSLKGVARWPTIKNICF